MTSFFLSHAINKPVEFESHERNKKPINLLIKCFLKHKSKHKNLGIPNISTCIFKTDLKIKAFKASLNIFLLHSATTVIVHRSKITHKFAYIQKFRNLRVHTYLVLKRSSILYYWMCFSMFDGFFFKTYHSWLIFFFHEVLSCHKIMFHQYLRLSVKSFDMQTPDDF